MKSKLSATYYLKNNKKRIALYIIVIAFYIFMLYLVSFMLDITLYTADKQVDYYSKVQMLSPSLETFGIDVDMPKEERELMYMENIQNMANEMKKKQGVKDAFVGNSMYGALKTPVGNVGTEIIGTNKEKVQDIFDYFDATLVEGRFPETQNEMIIDKSLSKNVNAQIGTVFKSGLVVVGIMDAKFYSSIAVYEGYLDPKIFILNDDKGFDWSKEIEKDGYKDVFIQDCASMKELNDKDYAAIGTSRDMVIIVAVVVLMVCLCAILSMHIRDRHEEWCLYHSIGHSTKSIYLLSLKELLIIFGLGICIGAVLSAVGVMSLYLILVVSNGLFAKMFMVETILKIGIVLLAIFAFCQLPVYFALNKIKTIDAITEEIF